MVDCKGYICGKFPPEECICETRDVEVRLEEIRTQLIDVARMTDDVTKYFFDQLIDEMLEIKNLLEKLNGESDTSRKDTQETDKT
jgi:hypothetical protein